MDVDWNAEDERAETERAALNAEIVALQEDASSDHDRIATLAERLMSLLPSKEPTHTSSAPSWCRSQMAPVERYVRNYTHEVAVCGQLQFRQGSAGDADTLGLTVWDGSIVLSRFLEHNQALVHGKRVLELGCGVGLVSVVCAALGAASVCATDMDAVLPLVRTNVALNRAHLQCAVDVQQLMWGETDKALNAPTYDVVVGADLISNLYDVSALLATLVALPGAPPIYLAYEEHDAVSAARFRAAALQSFVVRELNDELHPGFRKPKLAVVRLQLLNTK